MSTKSVMSNSNGLSVSTSYRDSQTRERLKLLKFKWDKGRKVWFLPKSDEYYDPVRLAVRHMIRASDEYPASYLSDEISEFLISSWRNGFGGVVLVQEASEKVLDSYVSALFQGCCDNLVIACSPKDVAKWEKAIEDKQVNANIVSLPGDANEIEKHILPQSFVIFDGIYGRNSKSFDCCCILSLPALFRVVLLNLCDIKTVEDIQNAVLLADPRLSPSYDFFRDHIVINRSKKRYSSKSYRAVDEFIKKVSPIVRRSSFLKFPVPVPVKPKLPEKALFERAKMSFTGAKSAKVSEIALIDVNLACKYLGEEPLENYITAKQEKALEIVGKGNFKVVSKYDRELREILSNLFPNNDGKEVLSLSPDPCSDFFLFAEKLEDKKAERMFDVLETINKFPTLAAS